MKFQMKSNYNDFVKRFQNISDIIDATMQDAVSEILRQMCEDMKNEINENRATWEQEGTIMEALKLGNDIEYEVSGARGIIHIGRNTPVIKMTDGKTVNPYLFIQFGYGIEGKANPVQYAAQNRWEYNVNKHTKAWWFTGTDGKPHWSLGRFGIDFFYQVMNKYRDKWKQIALDAFDRKQNLLGGF